MLTKIKLKFHHIAFDFFSFIKKGNERSIKAKKNILAMLFLKGGNILVNLMLIPITINYVNADNYGIWLTVSSIISWMSFFDIGINNGLKNKFAEAKAMNNEVLIQKYVSTTYFVLALIFVPLMILLLIANTFIDWCSWLNVSFLLNEQLQIIIAIVVIYFCINFVLSTINVILIADQRPAESSARTLVQQILSLIVIYVLTQVTQKDELLYLSLAFCGIPLLISLYYNVLLFQTRYKAYIPRLSCIDKSLYKELLSLGSKFFVIQIAAVIQYQTINFLIMRYYSASDVTCYSVAYKYFSILSMIFTIFIAPIWAATTEAYAKKDFKWIRNIVHKYLLIWVGLACVGALMLLFSTYIYKLWLGQDIGISFKLSLVVYVYTLVFMFGSIFVNILNGISALYIQFWSSVFSPLLFIGLCIFFIENQIGFPALILAGCLANFNGFIIAPIQYYKIFYKDRKGIWIR